MHELYDRDIIQMAGPANASTGVLPRLGIIGGGQLAKMTAQAALQLGCHVVVLEKNNYSPAATLASHSIVGDWNNPEALLHLASQVDVTTLENEFINADVLEVLEQGRFPLLPGAHTIGLVQDKLVQKQTFQHAGVPVPTFTEVRTTQDVERAGAEFGWPLLLKARRDAYDGKGNATLRGPQDIEAAWRKLGGANGRGLYVEEFCHFTKELAVIITRSRLSETAAYPVVETVQKDHVCHMVLAPADVHSEVAKAAVKFARDAVSAVNGVGSFGVELFLTSGNRLLLNEIAPRVHNSGHYSIEGCVCSQFENHVRAVMGWPLGDPSLVAPAAVMVNLLGDRKAVGKPNGLTEALAVRGAHIHIYGKAMSGPGRKMGHITALGDSLEKARASAINAAQCISFQATREYEI